MRFEGGHLGTLFSSHASGMWMPHPGFVVFGMEGMLTLAGPHGALTLHRNNLPEKRKVLLEKGPNPFMIMIGRYLDVVLDDAPNPSPGELGREELAIILAAYESARLGREVRVAEMGISCG